MLGTKKASPTTGHPTMCLAPSALTAPRETSQSRGITPASSKIDNDSISRASLSELREPRNVEFHLS
jgi:hypothetical protein